MVTFFAGCSSSPSAGDAEKALREQIDSASGRQISLISFTKTDGQKFKLAGVKGYKMDFEGEIEFATDGIWLSGGLGMPTSYEFKPGKPSGNVFQNLNDSIQGGQSVSSGSCVKISGSLTAEKTENGWKFHPAESHAVSKPTSGPSVHTGPVSKEGERLVSAKTQIGIFKKALDAYKVDSDYYPKGKNGLNDLIQKPRDAQKWYGPYLAVDKLPKDPWDHDYIYECPGQHNPDSYDLMSMGPDGRVGGGDDISNWNQ